MSNKTVSRDVRGGKRGGGRRTLQIAARGGEKRVFDDVFMIKQMADTSKIRKVPGLALL